LGEQTDWNLVTGLVLKIKSELGEEKLNEILSIKGKLDHVEKRTVSDDVEDENARSRRVREFYHTRPLNDPDLAIIYTEIRKESVKRLFCWGAKQDAEDIFQKFIMHALPDTIMGYNPEKKIAFRTYLNRSMFNYRIDEYRRELSKFTETDYIDDGEESDITIRDENVNVEEEAIRKSMLPILRSDLEYASTLLMNGRSPDPDKILSVHIRFICSEKELSVNEYIEDIRKIQGRPLREVAINVEKRYTQFLHVKTDCMADMLAYLERNSLNEIPFLEKYDLDNKTVRNKIASDWPRNAREKLRKNTYAKEIIDNLTF